MKSALAIVFSLMLLSCSDDNSEADSVSTHFDVLVKNAEGTDLLNPENPDAFTEESIKLYLLVDGERKLYYKDNYDHPHGFRIDKAEETGRYYLRVFPEFEKSNEESTVFLKFSSLAEDTIRQQYDIGPGYIACTKIWHNGNLVWDSSTADNIRYFEMVK